MVPNNKGPHLTLIVWHSNEAFLVKNMFDWDVKKHLWMIMFLEITINIFSFYIYS